MGVACLLLLNNYVKIYCVYLELIQTVSYRETERGEKKREKGEGEMERKRERGEEKGGR